MARGENAETKGHGGYEYWSARPGNRGGSNPGRATKRLTHRAERRAGRVDLESAYMEALSDPEWVAGQGELVRDFDGTAGDGLPE